MSDESDSCERCGAPLSRESVYSVVDVLDDEGAVTALLCRDCGTELRAFLTGDRVSVGRS